MKIFVFTVGILFRYSAIPSARLRNSASIVASSWLKNQSTAATRPTISSLATFMPRPTVFEFGELLSLAASMRSFLPKGLPQNKVYHSTLSVAARRDRIVPLWVLVVGSDVQVFHLLVADFDPGLVPAFV